MSVDVELLRAIVGNPDDLAPRLVYADWLEERGELDRATCIRVGCELDGVPDYDHRWVAYNIWRSEHRRAQPAPPLPAGLEWIATGLRGGFREHLGVYGADELIAHAPALVDAAPLRALTLYGHHHPLELARVLEQPWLARLRHLGIHGGQLGRADVERLAACEHIAGVRSLAMSFGGVSADGLAALLASPLVQQLDVLDLGADFFVEHGAPLASAFRDAPPISRLRELRLAGNRMAAGVLDIVIAPLAIERLDAYDNPLGDDGWCTLAGSHLRLTRLVAGKTYPGVAGVAAFARSAHAATLRSLDVLYNRLGPKAAVERARARWPELYFLRLSRGRLGHDGVRELARAVPLAFPKLLRADLWEVDMPEPASALAKAGFESTDAMRTTLDASHRKYAR